MLSALVKPCNFQAHPVFAEHQSIHPTSKPLASLNDSDLEAALVEICMKLETARKSS
ncbi:MAG: hypothetical protein O3C40_33240 [Planctomycetota bacterium]|nr:hypothetical protein [Planctomycetota bacterium]